MNAWMTRNTSVAYCIPEYVCAKLLQSCLALCNPMDCSPLCSAVHGILQARILEWIVIWIVIVMGIFPIQGLNPQLLYLLHWQ